MGQDLNLLLLDVDGVLTDGKVHQHEDGSQTRTFHARDRVAIRKLHSLGWEIHLVSMSGWVGAQLWATGLPVTLHQNCNKSADDIARITGGRPYVACGDDPADFPMLAAAAKSFTPRDAEEILVNMLLVVPFNNNIELDVPGGSGVVWSILKELGEAVPC